MTMKSDSVFIYFKTSLEIAFHCLSLQTKQQVESILRNVVILDCVAIPVGLYKNSNYYTEVVRVDPRQKKKLHFHNYTEKLALKQNKSNRAIS